MKKIIPFLLILGLILPTSCFSYASSDPLNKLFVSKSESSSSSKVYKLFPEFDPDITDYDVFLPDGEDKAYINAEPDDDDYTVYCDGTKVKESDDYYIKMSGIKDGDDFDIKVMDDDDDKLETYNITFHCGDDDDDDNATLDDLSVKVKTSSSKYTELKLNKDFDEDITEYKADIDSEYNSVQLYAEADDSDATVLIDGYDVGDSGSKEFNLTTGKNEFKITVYAENCDDTETYTVTLNYNDKSAYSSVLSNLSVKDSGSNTITLSPTFSSSVQNYTSNVANSVKSISIYATPSDSNAALTINNGSATKSTWTECTLKEGVNLISVKVNQPNAKDTITIYNINIYRQPSTKDTSVSSQKLTVDGISKTLNAYNINGNNFVKIRDIASLFSGTSKQFSVGFNETTNVVALISKSYYYPNGQENTSLGRAKEIAPSTQSIYLDGRPVNVMSYNIDGSNYVMLKDLALLLNFGLSYDSISETIKITTTSSYTN